MLGATGIITEEAAPLIGGLRARAGHLHLSLVILWISGGTYAADIMLYFLGRWHGDWVRQRWPKVRSLVLRVLRVVRRHPWRSSIAVRWAYGLRLTLPLACGAARVPLWLYAVGSAISAATWTIVFTLLGWGLGETALRLLGHLRRYEKWIGVAIVAVLIVALLVMRRQHVDEEVVDVIDSDALIPFLPHTPSRGQPRIQGEERRDATRSSPPAPGWDERGEGGGRGAGGPPHS